MNYEIVNLEEKTVVGLSARTKNSDPEMGEIIGGLWERFFGDGVFFGVKNPANEKSIGLYTDYSSDENGWYTAAAVREVSEVSDTESLFVCKIPKGKYAKFVVRGDFRTSVVEAWGEIRKTELPRSFVCDFEEYQNSDTENSEIHIYIGLKGDEKL